MASHVSSPPNRTTLRSTQDAKIRRERGRQAQRAFRQRQIDTIRKLKEENHALRAAIAVIGRAAAQDTGALERAITDAQELAKIQESEQIPLAHNTKAGKCGTLNTDTVGIAPKEKDSEDVLQQNHFVDVPHTAQLRHESDCEVFSPPNFDRQIRITGAPLDIIPFLGAEAYSVAGQIHWITMAYSYSAVRALRNPNPLPEAYTYVTKTFGHGLQRLQIEGILSILHGRLIYRKSGFMVGDEHPARDPSLGSALMLSSIDQCAPKSKRKFLTAFAVTDWLRGDLGEGFAAFEATLSGNANDRRKSVMKYLMRELAFTALCYGDGPRWDPGDVAAAARRWKAETAAL